MVVWRNHAIVPKATKPLQERRRAEARPSSASAWRIARSKGEVAQEIETFRKLSRKEERAVEAEHGRLFEFASGSVKVHAVSIASG
jgi:hypothetical protein